MERQTVESSHIKTVGYENGELEVEFKNGQIYRGECPQEYYDGLMIAESVGKYFNAIKTKIKLTKVEREE
jgi:hypothetical protein